MKKRVYPKVKTDTKAEIKTDWDYFDDCYVCQATKKADLRGKSLSISELRKVFKKANETN